MLAISAFQVANGLAAPFVGRHLDKMSLLWPVLIGYVLYCSGLALLSIANAYWQVIVIYASFLAVGQILFGTFVSQMLINRWFDQNKGLALGISATGTSLGGILFPLLISQALSSYSLSTIFQTAVGLFLVVLVPINFFLLRIQPPTSTTKQVDGVAQTAEQPTWTTKSILSSTAFWIPMVALLSVSMSFVAIQTNLGVYLSDLGYTASFTGQMIALIAGMMIVGKLLYGKLADSLDHQYILFFMGVTSIAGIALLMLMTDKVSLLMAAALLGISSGGLIPITGVVFAARFGAASFGQVVGLVMMVMILGSLGPIYAAWIYDLFGSYYYAFISFIVLIVPAMVVLKWLPPPLQQTT